MKREQKRLGNKGFSLVELIVVIAIMAVLVAVIAPTLIGKIEESREGNDLNTLGEVRSAVVNALTDEDIYKAVVGDDTVQFTISEDLTISDDIADSTKLKNELEEIIGTFEWKSDVCEDEVITIRVDSNGKVYALIVDADESGTGDEAENDGVLNTDDTTFEAGNAIAAPTS